MLTLCCSATLLSLFALVKPLDFLLLPALVTVTPLPLGLSSGFAPLVTSPELLSLEFSDSNALSELGIRQKSGGNTPPVYRHPFLRYTSVTLPPFFLFIPLFLPPITGRPRFMFLDGASLPLYLSTVPLCIPPRPLSPLCPPFPSVDVAVEQTSLAGVSHQ
jgi:hypothetical protein